MSGYLMHFVGPCRTGDCGCHQRVWWCHELRGPQEPSGHHGRTYSCQLPVLPMMSLRFDLTVTVTIEEESMSMKSPLMGKASRRC